MIRIGPFVRWLIVGAGVSLVPVSCGGEEPRKLVASRCVLDSDCDGELVCSFGRCHARCRTTKDCGPGERCVQADGDSFCQLESESSCTTRKPCTLPLVCATDLQCRNGCTSKDECLSDQVCAAGGFCADGVEVDDGGRLVGERRDGGPTGTGGTTGTGGVVSTGGADASADDSGAGGRDAGIAADAGPEDCDNGADDNGNGRIDCADPRCEERVCASAVPTGFTGPTIAWFGAASPPECPEEWSTELLRGGAELACDPAKCTCSCDGATGQTCAGSTSVFWNNTKNCPNGNGSAQPADGTCRVPNVANANRGSLQAFGNTPSGGSCAARKNSEPSSPPAWAINGRVCGGAFLQGGCPGGELCTPAPESGFKSCVYRDGDVDCPANVYTEKQVLYSGNTDDRACGCTCSAATGGTCNNRLQTWTNGTCQGPPATNVRGAYCTDTLNVQSFNFLNYVTEPGTCNAIQTVSGGCAPTGPTTVCCQP